MRHVKKEDPRRNDLGQLDSKQTTRHPNFLQPIELL